MTCCSAAGLASTSPAFATVNPPTLSVPQHGTGALVGGPVQAPPHITAQSAQTVPASVDLSQWAMPVGQQGSVGSCVPWAVNYNLMGWYANRAGQPFSGAPMFVYSQDHIDNSPDGGGSYVDDAFRIGSTEGVDTQADYFQGPFNFTTGPTAKEIANAAHHLGLAETVVYNQTAPGVAAVAAIEAQLAAGHPVVITFPVYSAFDDLSADAWTLDASQVDVSTFRGNHAVIVLGYDASGVRIENQWGTGWGQAGWANLNWNFIEQYSESASTMTGIAAPTTTSPAAPGVPASLSARATATTTASVSWHPPAATGGSAVTGYVVSRDVGGWSSTVAAGARSLALTLSPGVTYRLSVQAVNAVGPGAAKTVVLTMPKALGAPKAVTVVGHRAAGTATISWAVPPWNGQAITGYRVSYAVGGGWSKVVGKSARSLVVKLKPGVSYPLSVQAITATQTGAAASASITL